MRTEQLSLEAVRRRRAGAVDPEEYDRLYALEMGHWRFRALHRLLRRALLLHLDTISGDDEPLILDAGCGTGGTALALRDLGRFVGIDRSARALQWAARRAAGTSFVSNPTRLRRTSPTRWVWPRGWRW